MEAVTQFLGLPMPTSAAILRRIGGINSHQRPTGPFCLVGQVLSESRPCRIQDAFAQTMVVNHLINRQIFYRNEPKAVDDAPTPLMGKVVAAVGNTLVDGSHCLASPGAFLCSFLGLGKFALRFGKVSLIPPQETRVVNPFAVGQHRETFQSNVYPDGFGARRQRLLFNFTRKRYQPIARCGSADGAGLDGAFDGTVENHANVSDFRQTQFVSVDPKADADLRVSERVVTSSSAKARVARRFARLDAAKEGLEGKVEPDGDVLQHLRVNLSQRWSLLLELRQGGGLLVVGQRLFALLPSRPALLKQVIPEPATLFQHGLHLPRLFFRRIQTVFEGFKHAKDITLNVQNCQVDSGKTSDKSERVLYPALENVGFRTRVFYNLANVAALFALTPDPLPRCGRGETKVADDEQLPSPAAWERVGGEGLRDVTRATFLQYARESAR